MRSIPVTVCCWYTECMCDWALGAAAHPSKKLALSVRRQLVGGPLAPSPPQPIPTEVTEFPLGNSRTDRWIRDPRECPFHCMAGSRRPRSMLCLVFCRLTSALDPPSTCCCLKSLTALTRMSLIWPPTLPLQRNRRSHAFSSALGVHPRVVCTILHCCPFLFFFHQGRPKVIGGRIRLINDDQHATDGSWGLTDRS